MNRSHRIRQSRLALTRSLGLAALYVSALLAQPTLRITEPKPGAVFGAGATLKVVVEANPQTAFQSVIIGGRDPIGLSDSHPIPPNTFEIRIPADTPPGHYNLTADGVTGPGQGVTSESVGIQVEHVGTPSRLTAEPSSLHFQYGDGTVPVAAIGRFADAERVDVSESSYITYTSENPQIATVGADGNVTAAGPGTTRVRIRYKSLTTFVPVTVARPPAGK